MSNYSDHQKPRTNLLELLPEVYQSGVNNSLLEMLFNRFLTKSELRRVIGYIGQGNSNAVNNRQIQEPTPHRQAYQLQPILYSKIGTVEHMASWKDIQSELERLGVDLTRMKDWGRTLAFNWAPPIDYDKLLNYRDYYWENLDDAGDLPQYVTIQDSCTRAEAKVDEYQNTIDQFGATHTIVSLDAANVTISISNDLTLLFVEGFIFYVTNSTNTTINNEYYTTVSSSYQAASNRTDIVVSLNGSPEPFNDSIVNGDVSLEQLKQVFESEKDCFCSGSLGWDGGQWDDNQIGEVLWNAELLANITHSTELEWITANGTPEPIEECGAGSPACNSLWYDTTTDELKQYSNAGSPSDWVIVQSEFSEIIANTTGGELWDQSDACNVVTNSWIEQNKWVHKNQVTNFTLATQAQIPIIEFLPTLELNGWAQTTYEWKYRANPITETFTSTTVEPHLFELTGAEIDFVEVSGSPTSYEVVLKAQYGDLTSIFISGYQIELTGNSTADNNKTYTVDWSTYCEETNNEKWQTRVGVVEPFDVSGSPHTDGLFLPVVTSLGDSFAGLHEHWVFVGVRESQPINHQPINPMVPISTNPPPESYNFTGGSPANVYGSYSLSLFAQEVVITTDCFEDLDIVGVVDSSSSPSYWILNGNHENVIKDLDVIGRKLFVSGNTGGGVNGEYTIVDAVDSGSTTIVTVLEAIPATATVSGTAHFEWKLDFDSTLHDQTRFDSNELHVYIDDVRQYGTYEEINAGVLTASPINVTTTCDDFVNSIIIQTPVSLYGRIRIEVGAATIRDIGYGNVPVRLDENDITFTSPTDLQCVSLVRYRKLEQVKTQTNQYPLFDLYDVEGQSINIASKVFAFQESQEQPVDPYFGRRIVYTDARRVYYYEQFLIDEDNGPLYAYRDTTASDTFWFDSDNQILYRWTGITWDVKILTTDYIEQGSPETLTCYVRPIVNDEAPGLPWSGIKGMIWFNTNNNSINVATGSLGSPPNTWIEDSTLTAGVLIARTDPTLTTIWRTGPNDVVCEQRETYIPEYVDEDRNSVPVTTGSPPILNTDGDWEIPDQLYYNYLHENRKVLTSTELLAHFTSIINEQEVPPGLFGDASTLFHVLTDINLGKGGTIKEFNESYDTFLSSIFTQSVNPLQLYEFAHDANENALNQIKEIFRTDIESFMTDTSTEAIANLSADVADAVIEAYEQNDFANLVFGDSNTYNETTGDGVRNWPATLPFVRLAFKVLPQHFVDSTLGLNEIRHHDGHLSHIEFASTNVNAFNLRIINTTDTRVTNPLGKMGKQSNAAPPSAYADYFNVFGDTAACYWLHTTPSARTLYRMTAARVSSATAPPSASLPEGSYWYDKTNNRLKVLESSSWVNATSSAGLLTEGNVSAWEVIDLDVILAETILELETRLYNVAPVLSELAFDFPTTLNNEPALTSDYFEDAFFEFLAQTQIITPFDVSTDFDVDDAFTWNYKQSTPSIGGTWQDVYTKTYGTPYPHLEPWKLQGYNEKPSWWDSGDSGSSPGLYKDPTGTRKWTSFMWSNILDGIVPAGELLPNDDVSTGAALEVQDYAYVSVNIDSVTHDGYGPDDLFPPFWDQTYTSGAPTDFFAAQVRSIYTTIGDIVNPDDDYEYDDAGLIEWDWENSSQWLYDQLKVAFRLKPVEFIHDTLGEIFLNIGCLQVSQRSQKVYAHQDAIFHGDLLFNNTVQIFEGTLQWYANFNRFNGYDVSSSNFRPMWVNWTAPLSYQFGTFIDTEALLIYNRNFDITEQDYQVSIKRSPGIEDHWVDALSVSLLKAPPSLIRYDTESQWQFELNSYSPIGRVLTYYGTQAYQFDVITAGSPESRSLVVNDTYGRTLPWSDGDAVIVTTTQYLPSPLLPDTQYYVNVITPTQFSLSNQPNGPVIEILSEGTGTLTVANVARSFQALSGSTTDKIWHAYEFDKSLVLTQRVPTGVIGMQAMINIIFGYAAWTEDNEDFRFNYEATDIDADTGRVINWQLEVEKLIDSSYGVRNTLGRRHDSYVFEVTNSPPSSFNFITQTETNNTGDSVEKVIAPAWGTGTQVTVSTTGTLPDPLLMNVFYYIIRDNTSTFRLAITAKNARNGIAISLMSTGTGTLTVQDVLSRDTSPTFEVNPFKNNLWINTPQGIVSDMVKGPFYDVRTDQLIYDQFMDRLPKSQVLILREDKLTRIMVQDEITTPLSRTEFAHLTSAHVFIDGYEHAILFNNYASGGELIYDPFIGLNTPKFETQFDRSPQFTLRPNVGGYVLLNQQDVDLTSKLVRNIEGQVEDLRYSYDTYQVVESNDLVEESRTSLGYGGPYEFLSAINISPKSQFIFWRGMVQAKGSVNSINAFINSRRFIDAKIDEFWAVKVADFGDSKELSLPEINLFATDARIGEIRLDFVDEIGTADAGFIEITTQDQDRWYEYPNQQEFFDTVGNMYFNVGVDYIDVTSNDYIKPTGSPGTYYVELPYPSDSVVISDTTVTYTQINSQTIEFIGLGSPLPNFRIYLVAPYESKHNPCKIRDVLEEVTVADAILWDPARNNHYHNAIDLVDIQRTDDFAVYEYQISSAAGEAEEVYADNYDPWGAKEVGTTWLDVNELGFVPYSDRFINIDVLSRLKYWGRLSDWSSYKMYQWTESDVPPDEYDDLSEEQEGDFTIDEQIRVTGQTRKEIWKSIGGSPTGSPDNLWEPYPFEKYHIGSRLFFNINDIAFDISEDEPATLYKNGELVGTYESKSAIDTVVMSTSPMIFTDKDFVTVVKFIPEADGTTYKEITPYSTEQVLINGIPTLKYYFWVENKSIVDSSRNKDVSMLQAVQELETVPVPYVIPQGLQAAVTTTGSPLSSPITTEEVLPRRYTQAILRNFGSLINADDRYVLRFTRNFVLRDDLFDTASRDSFELKTIHQEWLLFRKEQPFNLARSLWDLMIESVIGQTISSLGGTAIRVPSLDRELYDTENNTSTRIGITYTGQSFCDGDRAWDAILQYLQDGDNDFTPVDIQTFFETHDILNLTPRDSTDAQAIYDMLDELYNAFTFENVNRIYFSVFNTSALPFQVKYQDMFKTSWVALHGIRILEVGGIFDS